MVLRAGQELKAAGQLFNLEGGAVAVIEALQFADQAAHGGGIRQAGHLTKTTCGQGLVGSQQDCFQLGQLRIPAQGITRCSFRGAIAQPAQGQGQRNIGGQAVRRTASQWTQEACGIAEHYLTL